MKKGFTLLELLIVIIIIGILAGVGLPRYFANIENARKAEAASTLSALREANLAQYAKTGSYFAAASTSPWTVDIDGDGTVDISVTPRTTNFTYAFADGTGTCVQADNVTGTVDYCMCVQSGKFNSAVLCAAATCP